MPASDIWTATTPTPDQGETHQQCSTRNHDQGYPVVVPELPLPPVLSVPVAELVSAVELVSGTP